MSQNIKQKPEISKNERTDELEARHPAFAVVSFHNNHYGQGADLFGANVRAHEVVTMRVQTAYMTLGTTERVYADKMLLEVQMSLPQFAQAITQMNHSDGVAATLRVGPDDVKRLQYYPQIERIDVEEQMKSRTDRRVEKEIAEITQSFERLKSIAAADGTISKKALKEAIHEMDMRMNNLPKNLRFYGDLLKEDTENLINEAKMDLHATATRIGVEAAREKLATIELKTADIELDHEI